MSFLNELLKVSYTFFDAILKWSSVIGLSFDIIGTAIIAFGIIVSKGDAISLGGSRLGPPSLSTPAVKDRIKQSHKTIFGLIFLLVGFVFQIIGSWPKS